MKALKEDMKNFEAHGKFDLRVRKSFGVAALSESPGCLSEQLVDDSPNDRDSDDSSSSGALSSSAAHCCPARLQTLLMLTGGACCVLQTLMTTLCSRSRG
jgi:hypothetical protein